MARCKITVLKRGFNKDYVDEYVESKRRESLGPCEVFHEGQEFVTDVISGMPPGFCSWAWDDLYKSLVGFFAGGDFGMWYERKDVIIACCTDGTRPVFFKIEKLPD
ncbi:MAG: TIGR04076 family protein [Spirochaetaceae bacterium]|nr:TIGR04076 family protein [Spirochaetaceae bacterium]